MSTDPKQELERKLKAYVGIAIGPPQPAPEPVNESMIRHWCEAMGDANPVYTDADAAARTVHGGIVAPPTMLQGWTLRGIEMADPGADAEEQADRAARAAERVRLHVGRRDQLRPDLHALPASRRPASPATTVIESISEEKATALGIGYFINTRDVYRDQHGEEVGSMLVPRAEVQAGTAAGRGRARAPAAPPAEADAAPRRRAATTTPGGGTASRAASCRSSAARACGVLRHPPRPMCGACQSIEWDSVPPRRAAAPSTATRCSTIRSFLGYDYPLVCAVDRARRGHAHRLERRRLRRPQTCGSACASRSASKPSTTAMTLPLFQPAAS